MKTPHSIPTPGDLYPRAARTIEQDSETIRTPIDQLTTAAADVMMDINTQEANNSERLHELTDQTLAALEQLALTSMVLQEIELNDTDAALTNKVVARDIQDLRSLHATYDTVAKVGAKDPLDGNSSHAQLVHLQTLLDLQVSGITIKTANGEQPIDFTALHDDNDARADKSPELTLAPSLLISANESADNTPTDNEEKLPFTLAPSLLISADKPSATNSDAEPLFTLAPSLLPSVDNQQTTAEHPAAQPDETLTLTPSLLIAPPEQAEVAPETTPAARQVELTKLANALEALEHKKRDLDAIIADDDAAVANGNVRPTGRRRASTDELKSQRSELHAQIATLMAARVDQLQTANGESENIAATPTKRSMGRFATYLAGRKSKRAAAKEAVDTTQEKQPRSVVATKIAASVLILTGVVFGIKTAADSNHDAPVADPTQNTQEAPSASQSIEDTFGNIGLQPSPGETTPTQQPSAGTETDQSGPADKSESDSNTPNTITAPKRDDEVATPNRPDITSQPPAAEAEKRTIDINSDAFIIPNGGGGEQLMRSLGLSHTDWYANHLDHQLQETFPDVFYSVGHGKHRDVRIAKPGELPQNVKQFIIDHTANN